MHDSGLKMNGELHFSARLTTLDGKASRKLDSLGDLHIASNKDFCSLRPAAPINNSRDKSVLACEQP